MGTRNNDNSRIGERAGSVLYSQWDLVCRLREEALGHPDLDTVHDLRVASRRLRATVGLLAPFIPGAKPKRLGRELRAVTRTLGLLRNLDELLAYLAATSLDVPVLRSTLAAARKGELKPVEAGLEAFPADKLDRLVRRGVEEMAGSAGDGADLPEYFSATAYRRFQAVHDLLPPALEPANAAGRHALRIAIKKWRYLLETAGAVFLHDYSPSLELLKEYQTLLGGMNDLEEFGMLCDGAGISKRERNAVHRSLGRDAAAALAELLALAASRPPQYTFVLEVNP